MARADPLRGEPRRSRLGQILAERPEARPRLRGAVVSLLSTALATIVVLGVLLIWHLRRRAQLIRDRLEPPRDVCLLDPSELWAEARPGDNEHGAERSSPPAGA